MRYTVIFDTRMTFATSATVRNRTSARPASAMLASAASAFSALVARGRRGGPALPAPDCADVDISHRPFGTCRCAGFPSGGRHARAYWSVAVLVGLMRYLCPTHVPPPTLGDAG